MTLQVSLVICQRQRKKANAETASTLKAIDDLNLFLSSKTFQEEDRLLSIGVLGRQ